MSTTENSFSLLTGDAIDQLATLPAESVHCCITSPPYWGLRDYGVEGQIGLEPTPEAYLERMVTVFREVWRVLRNDGTAWVNIGDSYAANRGRQVPDSKHTDVGNNSEARVPPGLKPKDLCMIPARLALALQADGWYLRQEIVWSKPNPMPESVTDRCTRAHEMVYMLSKRARYFYDAEAIKEPSTGQNGAAADFRRTTKDHLIPGQSAIQHRLDRESTINNGQRNRRSVWPIATKPFPQSHFAVFPPNLVRPMIRAGTSEKGVCPACGTPWRRETERTKATVGQKYYSGAGQHGGDGRRLLPERPGNFTGNSSKTLGWSPSCDCPPAEPIPATVLDPFSGAATTGVVALEEGRRYVGIELNPEYQETIARPRLAEAQRQADDARRQLTLFAE